MIFFLSYPRVFLAVPLIMASYRRIVRLAYVRNFLGGAETYFIAPTAWYYVRSLGQNEVRP